jgi:hypothetical protein
MGGALPRLSMKHAEHDQTRLRSPRRRIISWGATAELAAPPVFTARRLALRLCSVSIAKEDETGMEFLDSLKWLLLILAIVAVGFSTAIYLSTKYAKEADRAWPEHEAVEAEATSVAAPR